MSKCKFFKKHYNKGYVRCQKDGHITHKGKCNATCCPKYTKKFWDKILDKICGID